MRPNPVLIPRSLSEPYETGRFFRNPAKGAATRDVDRRRETCSRGGMANVLGREKREQVLALGRLGWSLRRIQVETGVHRETASAYLKAAGNENSSR